MKVKWWPRDLRRGDLIRVKVGSIWHYGVFVSEDEVIQFGEPPVHLPRDESQIEVCATDIAAFSCGQIVEAAELGKKRVPPEQSVAMARSRIGEKGYNLLHNNCEHFATECVLGKAECDEVDTVRRRFRKWRAESRGSEGDGD